jgi:YhcH/YjgK/YiaL family protein
MIIDTLANASCYSNLSEKIAAALDFLQKNDPADMAPGRYDIDGDAVFALVQTYDTQPQSAGKWEAHRRHIDIQYVARGIERIGYANLDRLTVSQPYSEENDFLLLEGQGNFLTVPTGTFAIFAPQDAHMPCIAVDNPQPVIKVVVKVRV